MKLTSNYKTIGQLGMWNDEKPRLVVVNAEWEDTLFRARLYPDINDVKVQTYLDVDNNPVQLVSVAGYKVDRFGARMDYNNLVEYDDHNNVDVNNLDELFARCGGDRTLQWWLPVGWGAEISFIDWAHPTFVG